MTKNPHFIGYIVGKKLLKKDADNFDLDLKSFENNLEFGLKYTFPK